MVDAQSMVPIKQPFHDPSLMVSHQLPTIGGLSVDPSVETCCAIANFTFANEMSHPYLTHQRLDGVYLMSLLRPYPTAGGIPCP
jgi:hypothetical protein